MELEEILAAPFTTPTTCFSCSPCADKNRTLPFRFVTENHILGLSSTDGSYRTVTYSSVPRDKPSVICVGMAQYLVSDNEPPLQALTFIDPLYIHQPEETPIPLQHPNSSLTTRGGIPDTSIRDDASIVSNTYSISVQDGSRTTRPQSRRPSFNTGPTGTTTTATATGASTSTYSTTVPRTSSENSMMRLSEISANTRTNTTHDPSSPLLSGTTIVSPKARLILQGPSSLVQDSIAILDFRPLAPCIAHWGVNDNNPNNNNNTFSCGVFVGSADDSLLRFYEPKENRLVLRSDLPKEHFQIDTPIMAMDFYSNGILHMLALAGQDGTIRIITWKGSEQEQSFPNISSHTVIVDGPLVCLQIQEQPHKNQLQIVIGSLCGYVCRLTCTLPSLSLSAAASPSSSSWSSLEWQGPTMVVQGLWNDLINDEDSVLAVHAFEDCIAIGTLAGRLLIYQASRYGDKYYKLWECILPYSIHGLHVPQLTNPNTTFDLMVITRRSLHVFRPTNPVQIRHDNPKYSVSAAKAQLQALLQTPPPQSEPDLEPDLPTSPTCSSVRDQEETNEQVTLEYTKDENQNVIESDEHVAASPPLQTDLQLNVEGEASAHRSDINDASAISSPTPETGDDDIVPQPHQSETHQETSSLQPDTGDNDGSQWVVVDNVDVDVDESKVDDGDIRLDELEMEI